MKNLSLIKLNSISKSYGNFHALNPINLQVETGERIALIGPSGAGKSTLLGILAGSIPANEGEYEIEGAAFENMNRKNRAENIGLIRQHFDLVGPIKVVHNVLSGNLGKWSLAKSLLSLAVPQDLENAKIALSRVGIGDKLYEKTSFLSGGERQRVALARLLVQNPKIVLADEPVASLDPARAEQILELLVNMTVDGHQTLIESLHSVDFAQRYFTRVIGLREGSVYLDKAITDLTEEDIKSLYKLEMQVSLEIDDHE